MKYPDYVYPTNRDTAMIRNLENGRPVILKPDYRVFCAVGTDLTYCGIKATVLDTLDGYVVAQRDVKPKKN